MSRKAANPKGEAQDGPSNPVGRAIFEQDIANKTLEDNHGRA